MTSTFRLTSFHLTGCMFCHGVHLPSLGRCQPFRGMKGSSFNQYENLIPDEYDLILESSQCGDPCVFLHQRVVLVHMAYRCGVHTKFSCLSGSLLPTHLTFLWVNLITTLPKYTTAVFIQGAVFQMFCPWDSGWIMVKEQHSTALLGSNA